MRPAIRVTCSLELLNTTRARSPDPQARGLLSHGRRRGRHSVPYTGRGAAEAVQHNAQTLPCSPDPFREPSFPLSVVGASTGAMHRSRGLLRTGRRRYRWCAKSRGIPTPNPSGIIYPHLWCYLLNVDSPDRHDRLKSLWSESGIRSITRVMSPALPWALPWAPALPRRAGHRELVRRWAHGHALW